MIVVTGGAGFIGSNIVAALEARGEFDVIVSDWLGKGRKWCNISKRELGAVVQPDNLFDVLSLHGDALEAVFHMGAISSTTMTDGDCIMENNFNLSWKLWKWCEDHGARFIYASSAATYGNGLAGFDDDNSTEALGKLRPLNLYGWSKHLFDRRVARLVSEGRPTPIQWVGLKFFNVYGPNEYHKGDMRSVAAQVYENVRDGRSVKLFRSHNSNYADGGQMRDFVWVKDCVDVMMWLYDNPNISGLFNLGTGKARSFSDLATAVFKALDREPEVTYVDTPTEIRDKYQYFTQADMSRLAAVGYRPHFTELEAGIEDYVKAYLEADDPYL